MTRRACPPLLLSVLLATGATEPATRPVSPVAAEARRILGNAKETTYTHPTDIDEETGRYHCDCSGLADYILKRVSPEHYKLLPHRPGKRPLAKDFYEAFTGAAETEGTGVTFQHVTHLANAREGDLLAWRRVELKPGEDTGHVVIVNAPPRAVGDGVYAVDVIDSTKSGHGDDTRKPGESGVGKGTMYFKVDAAGKVAGFRWRTAGTKFTELPIAVGRAVHLPEKSAMAAPATESVLKPYVGMTPDAAAKKALDEPGDAKAVAQRLFDLANAAYWEKKDLSLAVAFSQAGIEQAMSEADQADKTDPTAGTQLRGQAKSMAYNLASFTWAGWDEPGIQPTDAEKAAGRGAAALNLKLAYELHRPADKIAIAHWMVGAHALDVKDYDNALKAFSDYRMTANTELHRAVADGYYAIAKMASGGGGGAQDAMVMMDRAMAKLRTINSEDSKFFADQIEKVRAFYVK